MSFEIPAGLTDLLQDFTVAVLREKPADLVTFGAEYFRILSENRQVNKLTNQKASKGVRFGGGSDDEPMQTDSSDEEPFGMYNLICLSTADNMVASVCKVSSAPVGASHGSLDYYHECLTFSS